MTTEPSELRTSPETPSSAISTTATTTAIASSAPTSNANQVTNRKAEESTTNANQVTTRNAETSTTSANQVTTRNAEASTTIANQVTTRNAEASTTIANQVTTGKAEASTTNANQVTTRKTEEPTTKSTKTIVTSTTEEEGVAASTESSFDKETTEGSVGTEFTTATTHENLESTAIFLTSGITKTTTGKIASESTNAIPDTTKISASTTKKIQVSSGATTTPLKQTTKTITESATATYAKTESTTTVRENPAVITELTSAATTRPHTIQTSIGETSVAQLSTTLSESAQSTVTTANLNCPYSVDPITSFNFPETEPGNTAFSLEVCSNETDRPRATRYCRRNSTWDYAVLQNCSLSNSDLLESLDDDAPVEEIASVLLVVTGSSNITSGELTDAVNDLETLSNRENDTFNDGATDSLITVVENLLEKVKESDEPSSEKHQRLTDIRNATANILLKYSDISDEPYVIKKDTFSAKVISTQNVSEGITFGQSSGDQYLLPANASSISVKLPPSLFQSLSLGDDTNVAILVYKDDSTFSSSCGKIAENVIISISIGGKDGAVAINGLSADPVTIEFADDKDSKVLCVFYDSSKSDWSSEGGKTVLNGNQILCTWEHLTEFTVINDDETATTEVATSTPEISDTSAQLQTTTAAESTTEASGIGTTAEETVVPAKATTTYIMATETEVATTKRNQATTAKTEPATTKLNQATTANTETATTKSDQVNTAKTEPATAKPNQATTAKTEPTTTAAESTTEASGIRTTAEETVVPAKTTTTHVMATQTELVTTKPNQATNAKTEPATTQTNQATTAKTEPATTKPKQMTTAKTEPATTKPNQATTSKMEPTTTAAESTTEASGISTTAEETVVPAKTTTTYVMATQTEAVTTKSNQATTAKTEPATTQPNQATIAKTEPATTKPNQVTTAKTEPATTKLNQATTAKTEPATTKPNQATTAKTEPATTKPNLATPAKTEPATTKPNQMTTAKTEPATTKPNQATTAKMEPTTTAAEPSTEASGIGTTAKETVVPAKTTTTYVMATQTEVVTTKSNQATTAKTEPATTQPNQATTAKTEPATTKPNLATTAETEPATTKPNQMTTAKTEPATTQINQATTAKTEPATTKPNQETTAKTEPVTIKPNQMTTAKTEPATTKPNQATTAKMEPTTTAESTTEASGISTTVEKTVVPAKSTTTYIMATQTEVASTKPNQVTSAKTEAATTKPNQATTAKPNQVTTAKTESATTKPNQETTGKTETASIKTETTEGSKESEPTTVTTQEGCAPIFPGNLSFPFTNPGNVASSDELCDDETGERPKAVRYCNRNSIWKEIKYENCSLTILDLLDSVEGDTSIEDAAAILLVVSRSNITKSEVAETVNKFESLQSKYNGTLDISNADSLVSVADALLDKVVEESPVDKDNLLAQIRNGTTTLLLNLNQSEGSYVVKKGAFSAKVINATKNVLDDLLIGQTEVDKDLLSNNESEILIKLPKKLLEAPEINGESKIVVIFYNNKNLFPSSDSKRFGGGGVVSISVGDENGPLEFSGLNDMRIEFDITKSGAGVDNEVCVFFNYTEGDWSTRGGVTNVDGARIQCEWSHLTEFALLRDSGEGTTPFPAASTDVTAEGSTAGVTSTQTERVLDTTGSAEETSGSFSTPGATTVTGTEGATTFPAVNTGITSEGSTPGVASTQTGGVLDTTGSAEETSESFSTPSATTVTSTEGTTSLPAVNTDITAEGSTPRVTSAQTEGILDTTGSAQETTAEVSFSTPVGATSTNTKGTSAFPDVTTVITSEGSTAGVSSTQTDTTGSAEETTGGGAVGTTEISERSTTDILVTNKSEIVTPEPKVFTEPASTTGQDTQTTQESNSASTISEDATSGMGTSTSLTTGSGSEITVSAAQAKTTQAAETTTAERSVAATSTQSLEISSTSQAESTSAQTTLETVEVTSTESTSTSMQMSTASVIDVTSGQLPTEESTTTQVRTLTTEAVEVTSANQKEESSTSSAAEVPSTSQEETTSSGTTSTDNVMTTTESTTRVTDTMSTAFESSTSSEGQSESTAIELQTTEQVSAETTESSAVTKVASTAPPTNNTIIITTVETSSRATEKATTATTQEITTSEATVEETSIQTSTITNPVETTSSSTIEATTQNQTVSTTVQPSSVVQSSSSVTTKGPSVTEVETSPSSEASSSSGSYKETTQEVRLLTEEVTTSSTTAPSSTTSEVGTQSSTVGAASTSSSTEMTTTELTTTTVSQTSSTEVSTLSPTTQSFAARTTTTTSTEVGTNGQITSTLSESATASETSTPEVVTNATLRPVIQSTAVQTTTEPQTVVTVGISTPVSQTSAAESTTKNLGGTTTEETKLTTALSSTTPPKESLPTTAATESTTLTGKSTVATATAPATKNTATTSSTTSNAVTGTEKSTFEPTTDVTTKTEQTTTTRTTVTPSTQATSTESQNTATTSSTTSNAISTNAPTIPVTTKAEESTATSTTATPTSLSTEENTETAEGTTVATTQPITTSTSEMVNQTSSTMCSAETAAASLFPGVMENLTFPSTTPGELAVSEESCQNENRSKAIRYCSREGEWSFIKAQPCNQTNTQTLAAINVTVNPRIALAILNLVTRSQELDEEDWVTVDKLLQQLTSLPGQVQTPDTDLFLDVASNVINNQKESSNLTMRNTNYRNLGQAISEFVLKQDVSGGDYVSTKDSFEVVILPISSNNPSGIKYASPTANNSDGFTIELSKEALETQGSGPDSKVAFVIYKEGTLFPASSSVVGKVVSILIGDSSGSATVANLSSNAIVIKMGFGTYSSDIKTKYDQEVRALDLHPNCVFYNYTENDWANDGGTSSSAEANVDCSWDHATSFGVQVAPAFVFVKPQPVVMAGSGIATIICFFIVLVYLCFWRLRKDPIDVITLNFALMLCLAFLTYFCSGLLWGSLARSNCLALSCFHHFFLLSAFVWMVTMTFVADRCMFKPSKWVLWITLADEPLTNKMIMQLCLVSYGISLFIWIITISISLGLFEIKTEVVNGVTLVSGLAYSEAEHCVVKDWALFGGLGMPVILCFIFSVIVGIRVAYGFHSNKTRMKHAFHGYRTQYRIARQLVERALAVSVAMTILWLLQFLRVSMDDFSSETYIALDNGFGALCIIFSIALGLLLLLRPTHVRNILRKVAIKGFCISRGSYYLDHERNASNFQHVPGPEPDYVPTARLPYGVTITPADEPRPSISTRIGIREDLHGAGVRIKRWRPSDAVAQSDFDLTGGKLGLTGFKQRSDMKLSTFMSIEKEPSDRVEEGEDEDEGDEYEDIDIDETAFDGGHTDKPDDETGSQKESSAADDEYASLQSIRKKKAEDQIKRLSSILSNTDEVTEDAQPDHLTNIKENEGADDEEPDKDKEDSQSQTEDADGLSENHQEPPDVPEKTFESTEMEVDRSIKSSSDGEDDRRPSDVLEVLTSSDSDPDSEPEVKVKTYLE